MENSKKVHDEKTFHDELTESINDNLFLTKIVSGVKKIVRGRFVEVLISGELLSKEFFQPRKIPKKFIAHSSLLRKFVDRMNF